MTDWVIGDVQGCHRSLQRLLHETGAGERDRLFFVGDLVNRGPASLECLRLVRKLCEAGRAQCVLGNHDLHLLAVDAGLREAHSEDTLDDILQAPNRTALLDWLARQPLMIELDDDLVIHAGLFPDWTLDDTRACTREVEALLGGGRRRAFLARMYGNTPARWQEAAGDAEGRQRFTVNACTRMRFVQCDDHALLLKAKGSIEQPPEGGTAWFTVRRDTTPRVLFGHWSTLGTVQWPEQNVVCLDTGCVWNGRLTALDRATGALCDVPAAPGDGRAPI